tara:strand:+ start:10277 stop:11197 length:921 start_codon:yes stop_codon:yes gene_type:complete
MAKGGAPKNTTSTQDLPAWSKPYWKGIASEGKQIARQRYQSYGGDRTAGFTPEEGQAFQGVQSIYDSGPREELGQAQGIAQNSARVGANTPQWGSQALQQYQNPYLENVLDLGRDRMKRDYGWAMDAGERETRNAAVESGSYGGRSNLMGARKAAEISDTFARTANEYEADTRFGAVDRAYQNFDSDRSAKQDGARIALQSSAQLQSLANTQQEQAFQRISALQESGISQREMEQSMRDIAYNDFLDQQDWQRQQLNWFSGLLSGTPYATAMSTTQRTAGGGPGIGQTLAGLGIAGAGAYGAYKSG